MAQTYLTMDPGEQELFTAHRHWINIFPVLFSTVLLLAFISFALGWVMANLDKLPAVVPAALVSLVLVAAAVFVVLIAVIAYFIFRQNRVILTNRHYIQITQTGLFNRVVSKLTLDEIQDCKGTRRGFFATLLDYGDILIETAGEDENFEFGPVGDALNIAEAVNDAHQKYGHRSASSLNPNPEPESTPPPPSSQPTPLS